MLILSSSWASYLASNFDCGFESAADFGSMNLSSVDCREEVVILGQEPVCGLEFGIRVALVVDDCLMASSQETSIAATSATQSNSWKYEQQNSKSNNCRR
jgi:hypothetical protein